MPNEQLEQQQSLLTNAEQLTVFSPANELELIELLITNKKGTADQNYLTKLQSNLQKTPRIGTTAKPEFFSSSLIGTFTVLPNTQLSQKLNIKHTYIKLVRAEGQPVKTIKIALQLENEGKQELQLYTFANTKKITNSQHWSRIELEEIISQLGITQGTLESYKKAGTLQVKAMLYHVDEHSFLTEQNLELVEGREALEDLPKEFEKLVQPTPLIRPDLQNLKFTELTSIPGIQLENLFQKLSMHADVEALKDSGQIEAKLNEAAQAGKNAAEGILSQIAEVYRY